MTREEAKRIWPLIQAYSEGKTIEYLITEGEWVELKNPGFNYNANMYRIKSDPKYRPSKDQRDWSKFAASWYKKERFDPKTLQQYDKVLVRDGEAYMWKPTLFSYINNAIIYPYVCINSSYRYCIPYNDNTKYLAGTKKEAPEYYKYWED